MLIVADAAKICVQRLLLIPIAEVLSEEGMRFPPTFAGTAISSVPVRPDVIFSTSSDIQKGVPSETPPFSMLYTDPANRPFAYKGIGDITRHAFVPDSVVISAWICDRVADQNEVIY